jgi:hypothetical protein
VAEVCGAAHIEVERWDSALVQLTTVTRWRHTLALTQSRRMQSQQVSRHSR